MAAKLTTIEMTKRFERWSYENKGTVLDKDMLMSFIERLNQSHDIQWFGGSLAQMTIDNEKFFRLEFFEQLFVQFASQPGAVIECVKIKKEQVLRPDPGNKVFQLIFRFLKANAPRPFLVTEIISELKIIPDLGESLINRNTYRSKIKGIRAMLREMIGANPDGFSRVVTGGKKAYGFKR